MKAAMMTECCVSFPELYINYVTPLLHLFCFSFILYERLLLSVIHMWVLLVGGTIFDDNAQRIIADIGFFITIIFIKEA